MRQISQESGFSDGFLSPTSTLGICGPRVKARSSQGNIESTGRPVMALVDTHAGTLPTTPTTNKAGARDGVEDARTGVRQRRR